MKALFKMMLLALFSLHAVGCLAIEAEDLAINSLHRRIMNIARQEKLNVIVGVADSELSCDSASAQPAGRAGLAKIAADVGCAVLEAGDSLLIVERSIHARLARSQTRFYLPQNRPATAIAEDLQKLLKADDAANVVADDNLLVIWGQPAKIDELKTLAAKYDCCPAVYRIHLQSLSLLSEKFPDVSFLACSDAATNIEFNDGSGKKLALTAAVTEISAAESALKISSYQASDPARPAGEVSFAISAGIAKPEPFVLNAASGKLAGRLTLEIIDKPVTLPTNFPQKIEKMVVVSSKTKADAAGKPFVAVREPLAEILEKVASAAGTNMACSEACKEKISVFCFGEELYYEELMTLIARSAALSIRKIGNTWVASSENSFSDHFDYSYFLTRRLQSADLRKTGELLGRFVEKAGVKDKVAITSVQANNSIILSGNAWCVNAMRSIIDLLEARSMLISLTMSAKNSTDEFRHQSAVPVGRMFENRIEKDGHALTVGVVPVLRSDSGKYGIRYQCRSVSGTGEIMIAGYAVIGEEKSGTVVVAAGNESAPSLTLSLNASLLEAIDNRENEQSLSEDDSDADPDNAFDTSF